MPCSPARECWCRVVPPAAWSPRTWPSTAARAGSERAPVPAAVRTATAPRRVLPFRMGLPALDAFPRKLWSTPGRARNPAHHRGRSGLPGSRRPSPAAGGDCRLSWPQPRHHHQPGSGLGDRRVPGRPVADHQRHPACRRCGLGRGPRLSSSARCLCGLRVPELSRCRSIITACAIDVAISRAPKARLALVTPTHQSPLGVTLSLERRLSLLAWAARSGAWVLEDDYDSEFRYTGHPLPALKSLDDADRVLFAGQLQQGAVSGAAAWLSGGAGYPDAADRSRRSVVASWPIRP